MKPFTTKRAYSAMRLLAIAAFTAAGLIAVSGPAQAHMVPPPLVTSGVMVLDPANTGGALTLSGSAQIRCPIVYVNSSATQAVRGSGSAILDTVTLDVVGNVSFSSPSHCTGTVNRGYPGPATDPNSGMTLPAADPAHDLGTMSVSGGTRTLNPGYYSGGISLSGGAIVTLNPGIYVLGNNLTVSTGAITGNGVCFVMRGGRVTLSGGATATLTPPASGTLSGFIITQPATNTGALSLSGGSGMQIQGTIWTPGAAATVSGSSAIVGQGPLMGDMLICKRLTVSGSGLIMVGRPQAPQRTVVPPQLEGQFD